MSKTPRGVILGEAHVTDASRKTVFRNARGFDNRSLGSDSVPGPMVGAPLINSRTVDDFDAVRRVYVTGNPFNPLSTPDGQRGATMGVDEGRPPMIDAPGHGGPMPDRSVTTKAAEVRANDPRAGVGVRPSGTLNR
jgi:hypothetical protein